MGSAEEISAEGIPTPAHSGLGSDVSLLWVQEGPGHQDCQAQRNGGEVSDLSIGGVIVLPGVTAEANGAGKAGRVA